MLSSSFHIVPLAHELWGVGGSKSMNSLECIGLHIVNNHYSATSVISMSSIVLGAVESAIVSLVY